MLIENALLDVFLQVRWCWHLCRIYLVVRQYMQSDILIVLCIMTCTCEKFCMVILPNYGMQHLHSLCVEVKAFKKHQVVRNQSSSLDQKSGCMYMGHFWSVAAHFLNCPHRFCNMYSIYWMSIKLLIDIGGMRLFNSKSRLTVFCIKRLWCW